MLLLSMLLLENITNLIGLLLENMLLSRNIMHGQFSSGIRGFLVREYAFVKEYNTSSIFVVEYASSCHRL